MSEILYKYLDAKGGLSMLYNKNIMFTNATKLNDPFDCHPGLIDFSKIPSDGPYGIPSSFKKEMWTSKFQNYRDKTYLCSLSKVHDSLLMWSYYNSHKGICIGIDMDKAMPYLNKMIGIMVGCLKIEVNYRDVLEKPELFSNNIDFFQYQIGTKAKEWEHEKEVRLVTFEPSDMYKALLPGQGSKKTLDWKEVAVFCPIGAECFDSVYLGVNISTEDKKNIIKIARETNPNIEIYQMSTDSDTLKLKDKKLP